MFLNYSFRLFFVVSLSFCFSFQAICQLTARDADDNTLTSYTYSRDDDGTIIVYHDTIFVYHTETRGSLYIEEEEESDFNWHRFEEDGTYNETPFFTDLATFFSSQDDLAQGGYMVTVTTPGDAAPRDTFIAWLYMNPRFEFALRKNENGELEERYTSCFHNEFRLSKLAMQDTFIYYAPKGALAANGNPYQKPEKQEFINRISFTMQAGNSEKMDVRFDRLTENNEMIQYYFHGSPPHEDTEYTFTATDFFENSISDKITYITIIPYATINPPGLPESHPTSAPLQVKLSSTPNEFSDQNFMYTWSFGENDIAGNPIEAQLFESSGLTTSDTSYVYLKSNSAGYVVGLRIESRRQCIHEAEAITVPVSSPMLDASVNVFTPDGFNPFFKPDGLSIRDFEILIFTRGGIRIYRETGDDIREWIGWNGVNQNSNQPAPTGVYYYTIRALGRDDQSTRNPLPGPYHGFFYLFR